MSFFIFTDTSANLPTALLNRRGIGLIPLEYLIDGVSHQCLDIDSFDADGYYAAIAQGTRVTTSQVAPQRFVDAFSPALESGQDVLYVGMSSGISGTFASARIAAQELAEQFPNRRIELVDTLAASLGEGLFVLRAAALREEGLSVEEAALRLRQRVPYLCQSVIVEDLMHLHRGGRISGTSALLGKALGIRPLIKGDEEGHLVNCGKVRGRGKALDWLLEKYKTLAVAPETQTVAISYTSGRADAEALAERLKAIAPPRELLLVQFEPVTGSHLGPESIALFFDGDEHVRFA